MNKDRINSIVNIFCIVAITVSLGVIANYYLTKPAGNARAQLQENEQKENEQKEQESPSIDVELRQQSCLVFEHSTIDFGTIKGDSLLVADFVLTNSCDTAAYIFSVNPECTCTSYYVSKYEVLANDTALIRLTFDTKDRYGENRIYATVKDNSMEMHLLMLKVNIDRQ